MLNSSQKAQGAVSNMSIYYSMDQNSSYYARGSKCKFENEAGADDTLSVN